MRFRSKIDAWLIVPVGIGVSIPAITGISRLLAGRPGPVAVRLDGFIRAIQDRVPSIKINGIEHEQ